MSEATERPRMRIGFLGNGQIARATIALLAGRHDVVASFGRGDVIADELDLLVETATQQAVRERLPAMIARGTDVLLLSVGALADPGVRAALSAGPGRLAVCSGAIGGLDQVRALRVDGPLHEVTIESRKLPATLIQPWMDEALVSRLRAGAEEIVLDDALAVDVARRFPASANVAATLALAADAWDTARARIVADPAAALTRHTLHAAGVTGQVTVTVTNEPSLERPRSSAVVARAVVRSIDEIARWRGFAGASGFGVV